jgi:hypothetical protein
MKVASRLHARRVRPTAAALLTGVSFWSPVFPVTARACALIMRFRHSARSTHSPRARHRLTRWARTPTACTSCWPAVRPRPPHQLRRHRTGHANVRAGERKRHIHHHSDRIGHLPRGEDMASRCRLNRRRRLGRRRRGARHRLGLAAVCWGWPRSAWRITCRPAVMAAGFSGEKTDWRGL